MLFVSSLFIRCLFSCDVLVKFLLKIPSFLSCAKTNKERALEPCPSRAGAPGATAAGAWVGGSGPAQVTAGLALSHREPPTPSPSTKRSFKNKYSRRGANLPLRRTQVGSASACTPLSLGPQPLGVSLPCGVTWGTPRPRSFQSRREEAPATAAGRGFG